MPPQPPDRSEALPKPFSFEDLKNQRVEVTADGVLYRGTLIGADDENVYLKGRLRWLILPLDRIASLKLEGEREVWDRKKTVDASFYRPRAEED